MKTSILLATIAAACLPIAAFAQGELLPPPGPPSPTMKTLAQVEARTIINATSTPGDAGTTYIITLPGSYYLTSNLANDSGKHDISIQASDVTLDLNGFAIVNTTPGVGTVRGVDVPAEQKNVCVRNGTVRLWNGGGVRAENARNAVVEKLRVSDCTGAEGIYVGLGSVVKDCVANANGIGIRTSDRCQVKNCVSTENTGRGFDCTSYVNITDCNSSRNGSHGIVTLDSCSITRCSSTSNFLQGAGIFTRDSCTITDCVANSNEGGGSFTYKSNVANCTANSNGAIGIFASASSVSHSTASHNRLHGIDAAIGVIANCKTQENILVGISVWYGSVTNCTSVGNRGTGIEAIEGNVTNSMAWSNKGSGIWAYEGSITNCVASGNGNHGIDASNSVVAFCNARSNNNNNNGSQDINVPGASHRTGNVPSP